MVISDIPQLDDIEVYLEDYEKGRGKIIITCFNKSWTYYWGSMGDTTLAQFISSCDNWYLSGKLNPDVKDDIQDDDKLNEFTKKHIIKRRKEDCLDKKHARELYNKCYRLDELKYFDSEEYANMMDNVFGDEWWYCYPTKPNPEYNYFCRILDIVKEALKTEK